MGSETYLDKKMNVEIGASCVLLVRVLNSTSFDEINTLLTIVWLENASLNVKKSLDELKSPTISLCVYLY